LADENGEKNTKILATSLKGQTTPLKIEINMWIKKTEEEIKNTYKKDEYIAGFRITPIRFAIIFFVFIMFLQISTDLIFGKSLGRFYLPVEFSREKITFSDLQNLLPEYICSSSIITIFLFILYAKIRSGKPHCDTYLCQKCNKVKLADKNFECECGGEYIEIDKMKWVEDNGK